MFEKIEVNGEGACELYRFLKNGEDIKWNFAKFLVDGDGKVVKRYEPKTTPEEIEPDINV